jgi:hypothetical protein
MPLSIDIIAIIFAITLMINISHCWPLTYMNNDVTDDSFLDDY